MWFRRDRERDRQVKSKGRIKFILIEKVQSTLSHQTADHMITGSVFLLAVTT